VEVKTSGGSPKTVAKYGYNGLKHRIRKEVYDASGALATTVLYFNNLGWQCLESRETPVVGSAATTTYVWGQRYIDDLVCRDSGGTRLYAMQDRQYKMLAIADASGAVQERYGYTPYGVTSAYASNYTPRSASSYAWTCLYTGREFDLETGLYYFRNRYYNASLGRFVSRDPIGYEGSEWNLYEYVYGQALSAVDPMGLDRLIRPSLPATPTSTPFPRPTTPQAVLITVCTYVFYEGGQRCVRPICNDIWYWLRPSDQPPIPTNRTLDHCLDLGDADYDDRADYCAQIRNRQQRAICYSHCNDNKNQWNNYCRSVYLP